MVIRHEFGREGLAYVRAYLESGADFGKPLGGLLMQHHDVEQGTVWAFVPADSSAERLVAFESGGLSPKMEPDWRSQADAWLRGRLSHDGSRILLIEHPYAQRTDGWLEMNPARRALFCGDDVYEYFLADDSELQGWLGGATWRPHIGIVTAPPAGVRPLRNRQSISTASLSAMAAAATAVVLGAWDDKGWLAWEPEAASSGSIA